MLVRVLPANSFSFCGRCSACLQLTVMGAKFPFSRLLPRLLAWLPLRVDEAEVAHVMTAMLQPIIDRNVRNEPLSDAL